MTQAQHRTADRWRELQAQAHERAQAGTAPVRLTQRGRRARGAVRVLAAVAVAVLAWYAAGAIADGAVGCGPGQHCNEAQAATVAGRCVTLDTGANVARMGRMRYRYIDAGDGLTWQAGTPRIVRHVAAYIIARHAAAHLPPGTYTGRACGTFTD